MPIANPTPKSRFRSLTENVSKHRELVAHPQFDRSMDFALAEYQRHLAVETVDFNHAAKNHFRMTGALEFLQILRNLSEEATLPKRVDADNLDHNRQ